MRQLRLAIFVRRLTTRPQRQFERTGCRKSAAAGRAQLQEERSCRKSAMGGLVIDKTHHTGAKPPVGLRDNGLCTKTRRIEALRHGSKFPLYVVAYNLACPASPIHNQHFPFQTRKSSVMGAINVLGWTKALHA